jgi:hypothetical protein
MDKGAITKAKSVLFSGKNWFSEFVESSFNRVPATKKERAEFLRERQYFFFEYQRELWSDTFRNAGK